MTTQTPPPEAECELIAILDEMGRTDLELLPELGRRAVLVIERVEPETVKKCLVACLRGLVDGIEHGMQGATPKPPEASN